MKGYMMIVRILSTPRIMLCAFSVTRMEIEFTRHALIDVTCTYFCYA